MTTLRCIEQQRAKKGERKPHGQGNWRVSYGLSPGPSSPLLLHHHGDRRHESTPGERPPSRIGRSLHWWAHGIAGHTHGNCWGARSASSLAWIRDLASSLHLTVSILGGWYFWYHTMYSIIPYLDLILEFYNYENPTIKYYYHKAYCTDTGRAYAVHPASQCFQSVKESASLRLI